MRFPAAFLSSTLPMLIAGQTTNGTIPTNLDLEFHLVQCTDNFNTMNPATRTWSYVGLYSPHTPQQWQYSMPLSAMPYQRYEGHETSAYFWAEAPNPRGFLHVQIPAEAATYKTDVEAGKVVFEGKEFPCQKKYGLPTWSGAVCEKADYEFCAGYMTCHQRFVCKTYDPPLEKDADKVCIPPTHGWDMCYPYWNPEG